MLIIPSIDGNNLQKCTSVLRVLRGFVSIISLKIDEKNNNLQNLMKLFDRQATEIELFISEKDHDAKLQKVINTHNDVNVGKVYFYTDNTETVEDEITKVRIFGIQPGLIVDKNNYDKLAVINKFEYAVLNVKANPDFMTMYKKIKDNDFKGNLFLDFESQAVPQDILKNLEIDGIYTDVTMNPMIKDTISSYRRLANSMY